MERLTDEEIRELRDLIKRRKGQEPREIETVSAAPTDGDCLGRWKKWYVWVKKKVVPVIGWIWLALLVPIEIQDALDFWWPKTIDACHHIAKALEDVESGRKGPAVFRPSKDYLVAGEPGEEAPTKPFSGSVINTTGVYDEFQPRDFNGPLKPDWKWLA